MIPTSPVSPIRHPSPRAAFTVVAWSLLALWVFAWLAGPTVLSLLDLALNPHGHAPLRAHGHPFVDARSWWGVPNTLDVLSNLPLVLAGATGLWSLQGRTLNLPTRNALRVFFAGLVLCGLGSATYHWAPDASSLVIDRLGMAVAFAGVLALSVAERVGRREARIFLPAVLVLAVVSAALPHLQGNVLPWAVVQFGGMGLVVWAASRRPVQGALGVSLIGLIALYAVAKLLEFGDEAVFRATGEWVSGHSLKHVAAASAAFPILVGLGRHRLGDNAPVPPSAMA
ncbi:MAG: hypothetical protein DCF26_15155 [Burkholderiales bacterium]|nr:MAG: hypothetical protein DCF26_15155 [Burkholderiales bacterium]